MKSIGFRAEASAINWAVVDATEGNELVVIADSTLKAPKTYSEAQSLSWFRDHVLRLVDEHKPAHAGIRYPETYGRAPRHRASANARLRIEGVIVEALNSQSIPVSTGATQQISSRLGSKSAKNFKAYIDNENFRGLDLSKRSDERREAILVAVSSREKTNGR